MPEFEPSPDRTAVKNECLADILDLALNDQLDWAMETLNEKVRASTAGTKAAGLMLGADIPETPEERVARLRCGKCDAKIALYEETGSIKILPPGCELGKTIT